MFVNLYKMASRKKCSQLPFPHRAHWNKYKDGMSSDAIEGVPSNFGNYSIFSSSMPVLDNLSQPIFQSILNPDDSSYALSPKSHNDPRNPLRQSNHRSHIDHMDDEEMLRHWQECVAWMDKEEALMESNLGLVSNGEFLTPFEDEDYPSIEETLDETNSRITNPSKILNIQIRGEDNINEHEIYSLTISLKTMLI
jgi:hypothetical protein